GTKKKLIVRQYSPCVVYEDILDPFLTRMPDELPLLLESKLRIVEQTKIVVFSGGYLPGPKGESRDFHELRQTTFAMVFRGNAQGLAQTQHSVFIFLPERTSRRPTDPNDSMNSQREQLSRIAAPPSSFPENLAAKSN
ncbi:MAG: hypothetical protein R3268_10280, partial [Acidiferrobacterales bacterium]|nr:hypothetical protein [Acidiferrobacterales bacterium]